MGVDCVSYTEVIKSRVRSVHVFAYLRGVVEAAFRDLIEEGGSYIHLLRMS